MFELLLDLLAFYANIAIMVLFAWLGVLRWTPITSVGDLLDRLNL